MKYEEGEMVLVVGSTDAYINKDFIGKFGIIVSPVEIKDKHSEPIYLVKIAKHYSETFWETELVSELEIRKEQFKSELL